MAIVPYVAPQTSIIPYAAPQQAIQKLPDNPTVVYMVSNNNQLAITLYAVPQTSIAINEQHEIIIIIEMVLPPLVGGKPVPHTVLFKPNSRSYSTYTPKVSRPHTHLVNQVIIKLLSDKELLTKGYDLPGKAKAVRNVLFKMVDEVPEGPFKEFIKENFKYNVEVLATTSNNTIKLNQPQNLSQKPQVDNSAGVYLLRYKDNLYVGSSVDLKKRLQGYYEEANKNAYAKTIANKLLKLSNKQPQEIEFGVIYKTPNIKDLFYKQLPDYDVSTGELLILSVMTEYVPRVLEQLLINEFKPNMNSSYPVEFITYAFNPLSLNKGLDYLLSQAKPVTILDSNYNVVQRFAGMKATCDALNVSFITLEKLVISGDFLQSFLLNMKVAFWMPGRSKYLKKQLKESAIENLVIPGKSLASLHPKVYWAFHEDKVNHNPGYKSLDELVRKLFPVKSVKGMKLLRAEVLLHVNLERLLVTEVGSFYIAVCPLGFPRIPNVSHVPKTAFKLTK